MIVALRHLDVRLLQRLRKLQMSVLRAETEAFQDHGVRDAAVAVHEIDELCAEGIG